MDPAGEIMIAGFNSLFVDKKVFMQPNLFASGASYRVKRAAIVPD
jgi:hypothetical protein